MNSSSAPSNASAASRSDSSSSSTRKSGSMPALRACARSTREQKPWMVEIHALSEARASSRRPSSRKRCRTRVRISAAAFSVKVIASIDSTPTSSSVDRPHEALHQHGRLAGARAGAHEQRAVAALDRALLLRRQLAHRSLLQIEGYLQPPFQSQLSGREQISPLRMRASVSRMRSSAQSSFARKASELEPVVVEVAAAELVHVGRDHPARPRVVARRAPRTRRRPRAGRAAAPPRACRAPPGSGSPAPSSPPCSGRRCGRSCSRSRAPCRRSRPRGRCARAGAGRPRSRPARRPRRSRTRARARPARSACPSRPPSAGSAAGRTRAGAPRRERASASATA